MFKRKDDTDKRKLILLLAALLALLFASRILAKSVTTNQTKNETKNVETISSTPEVIKTSQTASTQATEPNENACIEAMKQYFPEDKWDVAIAIMTAESGLNPKAKSATNDFGCFQIHNWELYDPIKNAEVAYYKDTHYGWSPWTTYTSGSYKRFL